MKFVFNNKIISPLFWDAADLGIRFLKSAGFFKVQPLQVTSYTLASPDWHYGPLKIAVASDFHVGSPFVDLEYLERAARRINELEPDIILLPGDFVNSPTKYNGVYIEPEKIARVLSSLSAPGGVYGTLGNHDWFEGGPRTREALENAGISMLENASVKVELGNTRFWISGVGDHGTGHADLSKTFSAVTDGLPVIAMCHNPYSIYGMPLDPVITFAGHTHGGQFKIPLSDKIPFLKAPLEDCPDKELFYGLMEREGRSLCVNSGMGSSFYPIRNVPPEIVEFTLIPG
jgi:uncharacterized protein